MDAVKDRIENFCLNLHSMYSIEDVWSAYIDEFLGKELIRGDLKVSYRDFSHIYSCTGKIISEEDSEVPLAFPDKKGFECNLEGHVLTCSVNDEDGFLISQKLTLRSADIYSAAHRNIILLLFSYIKILLKIKNLENHTVMDELTQLYNQNYMKNFIDREIERGKRFATQFAVVFFDLDNLKQVNSKFGHLYGTEVIKKASSILKAQVRNTDIVCRFGGDEFVIVILNSDDNDAFRVCERLRKAVNNNLFLMIDKEKVSVTGSFGISLYPEHGNKRDVLIHKADLAMYEAKNLGKNGIYIHKGEK